MSNMSCSSISLLITIHFYKQHDMFSASAAKLYTHEQFANKFSNKLTPVKHKRRFMTLSISNNNVDDNLFYYQPSSYSGWKDNRWVGRSAACFAMYSPLCLFVAHILRSYGHIFYWKAHLNQVHKGCRHINTLLDYILTSAERPRWIFINVDAHAPSPFITSVHRPSKPSSLNFFMNIKGCIMSAHRLTALELILLLS